MALPDRSVAGTLRLRARWARPARGKGLRPATSIDLVESRFLAA
jgi:hypothetical protein